MIFSPHRMWRATMAGKKLPPMRRRHPSGGHHPLRLVVFDDLPVYLRDNEFIRWYYRCEWPIKDALLNASAWYNEMLNVWTHLGGFFLFLELAVAERAEATQDVIPGLSGFMVKLMNGMMKEEASFDVFLEEYVIGDEMNLLACKHRYHQLHPSVAETEDLVSDLQSFCVPLLIAQRQSLGTEFICRHLLR